MITALCLTCDSLALPGDDFCQECGVRIEGALTHCLRCDGYIGDEIPLNADCPHCHQTLLTDPEEYTQMMKTTMPATAQTAMPDELRTALRVIVGGIARDLGKPQASAEVQDTALRVLLLAA